MAKRKIAKSRTSVPVVDYDGILAGMVDLLKTARRMSARAVNSIMTATFYFFN